MDFRLSNVLTLLEGNVSSGEEDIDIDVKPEKTFHFRDILDVKNESVSHVDKEKSDTNLEQKQADMEVEGEQAVQIEPTCDKYEGESQCLSCVLTGSKLKFNVYI